MVRSVGVHLLYVLREFFFFNTSYVNISHYYSIYEQVHHMGYEHGGLSEMYDNEYISEERRLKQIQENKLNEERLNGFMAEIKDQEVILLGFKEKLKALKSPEVIEKERMERAEEKAKKDPDSVKHAPSSFFSRIVGSSHDGITPDEYTEKETEEINKWKYFTKQVHNHEEKLEKLEDKKNSTLKTLNNGVSRARKMLMERELNVLELSRRRDFSVSMALTALTYVVF